MATGLKIEFYWARWSTYCPPPTNDYCWPPRTNIWGRLMLSGAQSDGRFGKFRKPPPLRVSLTEFPCDCIMGRASIEFFLLEAGMPTPR